MGSFRRSAEKDVAASRATSRLVCVDSASQVRCSISDCSDPAHTSDSSELESESASRGDDALLASVSVSGAAASKAVAAASCLGCAVHEQEADVAVQGAGNGSSVVAGPDTSAKEAEPVGKVDVAGGDDPGSAELCDEEGSAQPGCRIRPELPAGIAPASPVPIAVSTMFAWLISAFLP